MCRPKKLYEIEKSSKPPTRGKLVLPSTNGDENVEILSYKKLPEHAPPPPPARV